MFRLTNRQESLLFFGNSIVFTGVYRGEATIMSLVFTKTVLISEVTVGTCGNAMEKTNLCSRQNDSNVVRNQSTSCFLRKQKRGTDSRFDTLNNRSMWRDYLFHIHKHNH